MKITQHKLSVSGILCFGLFSVLSGSCNIGHGRMSQIISGAVQRTDTIADSLAVDGIVVRSEPQT